jgi:DNA-directed RNA polymerase subunit RPC12/RpoP
MPDINLQRRKYDLFLCAECNNIAAYREGKGDGHACQKCGSQLHICIGTYKFDKFKELRDDGLTEQEGKVADALVTAWNEFCKLENWHPSDAPTFCEAIHQCQQILAMRIVQREFPKGWPIKSRDSG